MTRDLQVSFRQLIPSEELVGLAVERYRRLEESLNGPSLCLVSLELRGELAHALTVAQVRLECRGDRRVQAEAWHRDPYTALETALASLESQLSPHSRN